jgi:hypothetical protein
MAKCCAENCATLSSRNDPNKDQQQWGGWGPDRPQRASQSVILKKSCVESAKSGSMGHEGNEAGERANHISEGTHDGIGIGLLGRRGLL